LQTILLDSGTAALAQAIAEGTPLQVVAYHIGQGANYNPSTTATDVIPVPPVYVGDATTIAPSVVSNNEIRYVITLVETLGPFGVGNIMLFLQLGDDPTLIPYILGVLPVPVPKYASNPPATIGNRLVFNLTAKYVNIATAFTLNVITPEYASLFNYIDENGLPPATNTAQQQSVLQNLTSTGSPAIALRRTLDNSWYLLPFTQRLDDPNYGALSGGVVGDGYVPYYGDWYAGGFYVTPLSGFNNYLIGGTDWATPTISDDPVQGGSY
jgi:hypothetical protein